MPMLFVNVRIAPTVDSGMGGMPFHIQSPLPGFALVGLVVRAGKWIDQVAPIFGEVRDDGTLGPDIHGRGCGGQSGLAHQLHAAPGYVVTGLQTRSGKYIDAIRLHQTKWEGALGEERSWTPWCGGDDMGGVERTERYAEPGVVIGIAGRASHYVDSLTIMTAEIVKVQGTIVAGKSAARAARSSSSAG